MNFSFRPARRSEAKPLIGLYAESGRGKTYSALLLARGFVGPQGRIAMIDTEAGRGEAYADLIPGGYDVLPLRDDFSPENFGKAIKAAEAANYDALIIDSASHEWSGQNGVLAQATKRQDQGLKGVLAWQKPKLDHQRHFMLPLLQTPIPLVVLCLRAKYPMVERKDNAGKKEWVRSDALEPDQASDILFEMFIHGWIDAQHRFRGTKYTRPDLENVLKDGEQITIETGRALAQWASGSNPASQVGEQTAGDGAAASQEAPQPPQPAAPSLTDLDERLAEAAEQGVLRLQHVWTEISKPEQRILKAALDRRHKPRALEVELARK